MIELAFRHWWMLPLLKVVRLTFELKCPPNNTLPKQDENNGGEIGEYMEYKKPPIQEIAKAPTRVRADGRFDRPEHNFYNLHLFINSSKQIHPVLSSQSPP